MATLDPDDLSLLATLAENPSLSKSTAYAAFLRGLKPQSRRLAEAIVSEAAPAAAGQPAAPPAARAATGARKKAAGTTKTARAKRTRTTAAAKASAGRSSTAKKRARSILKWATENRSRKR